MPWTYHIRSGQLFSPDMVLVATGYAGGNCGKTPEGINNPRMCGAKNIGPLPPGVYTFGRPLMKSHLGPVAIPLDPDLDNDMLGRSGFFMHGDRRIPRTASEGCIIMPRAVRQECADSYDTELVVVAE